VVADGAAGGSAEDGVVAGDVAADGTDRRSLQASLRAGEAGKKRQRRSGDAQSESEFHGRPFEDEAAPLCPARRAAATARMRKSM
jgi:hypothetical protein